MKKLIEWFKSLFQKKPNSWPTTEVPKEEWDARPIKSNKKFSKNGHVPAKRVTTPKRYPPVVRQPSPHKHTAKTRQEARRDTQDNFDDVGSFVAGAALGAALGSLAGHTSSKHDSFSGGGGTFDGGGASSSWDSSLSSDSMPDFSNVDSGSSSTANITDN